MDVRKLITHILPLIVIVSWLVFLFFAKREQSPFHSTNPVNNTGLNLLATGIVQDVTSVSGTINLQSPDTTVSAQMDATIERYDLQQLDVSAVKELFSSVSSMTTQFDTIEIMEHVYKESGDQELLKTMIALMVQQYRFEKAYGYIKTYESTNYSVVDPHTALNILLNSDLVNVNTPDTVNKIRSLVDQYAQGRLITADDASFYKSIIALLGNNYDQFIQTVRSISDPKYANFKADIEKSFQRGQYRKDLPAYYLQALLALNAMEYGYFKVAQQIAIAVLMQNDGYDLPYQILAYTHFVMNNRDRAIEYFHILLEQQNATMQDNYKLLLGIAYYRDQQYKESVIQITQLPKNNQFRTDALRYQLASYLMLGDLKNAGTAYQLVLGQTDVAFEDFYGYFENALYKPLVQKEEPVLAKNNEILISQYVDQCFAKLEEKEQYICEYGQAGKFLYENNIVQATSILENLAEKVNKSYIFAALGDFYHRDNQIAKAQEMYTKAVALAVDERLKQSTQQKLLQMVQPVQSIE